MKMELRLRSGRPPAAAKENVMQSSMIKHIEASKLSSSSDSPGGHTVRATLKAAEGCVAAAAAEVHGGQDIGAAEWFWQNSCQLTQSSVTHNALH